MKCFLGVGMCICLRLDTPSLLPKANAIGCETLATVGVVVVYPWPLAYSGDQEIESRSMLSRGDDWGSGINRWNYRVTTGTAFR